MIGWNQQYYDPWHTLTNYLPIRLCQFSCHQQSVAAPVLCSNVRATVLLWHPAVACCCSRFSARVALVLPSRHSGLCGVISLGVWLCMLLVSPFPGDKLHRGIHLCVPPSLAHCRHSEILSEWVHFATFGPFNLIFFSKFLTSFVMYYQLSIPFCEVFF